MTSKYPLEFDGQGANMKTNPYCPTIGKPLKPNNNLEDMPLIGKQSIRKRE